MSGQYIGVRAADPTMQQSVDACQERLNQLGEALTLEHGDTEPVVLAMVNVLCDMMTSAKEDSPQTCDRLLDAIASVLPANFPNRFTAAGRVH